MCTKETKVKIIDQIDIINQTKHIYSALYFLMRAAADAKHEIDFTRENLENLAWLLDESIMKPLFKAGENIYQVLREEGK